MACIAYFMNNKKFKRSSMPTSKKSKASTIGSENEDAVIGSPSWTSFKELWACIWIYKYYLVSGLGLALTATASTLLEPWLLGWAVDVAIIPKDLGRLRDIALLLAFIEMVRVGSLIAEAYLFSVLGQKVMQDLRVRLFSHMLHLPVNQFDKMPVGRFVTRVTNDISSLNDMFASGFVTIIGNVLVALGIVVALVVIDWKLGLITCAIFPVLIFFSVGYSRKLKLAYAAARTKLSSLNAFLSENIQGMRTLNALNRQQKQLTKFEHLNRNYADAQFGTVKIFALFQPSITLCTGISMTLLVWYGGGMVMSQEIKVGLLVSFFAYVMSLFQPVREVADKWNVILAGMTSAERIFSVLRWSLEPVGNSKQSDDDIKGHIQFENVWFAYNDDDWVLKDFSFEAKAGQKIGLVGPTGSGKTTVINLLLRFYEPQKGRILLDGKDLKDYDLKRLRTAIGFVQQDVFLFSGTVKDNIVLWRGDTEPPSTGFTQKLGDRLHEGGTNISRGERQIIAFCRALYSNPKLWILDEATANVDSQSEKNLETLLEKHSDQKTILAIAHRLATIRHMDKILVLNKGLLVESGNHEELLRQNGLYARLYTYQVLVAQPQYAESANDHHLDCKS
jgi:ATP-binding cassette, subfamily B, multidrug efflux pump